MCLWQCGGPGGGGRVGRGVGEQGVVCFSPWGLTESYMAEATESRHRKHTASMPEKLLLKENYFIIFGNVNKYPWLFFVTIWVCMNLSLKLQPIFTKDPLCARLYVKR